MGLWRYLAASALSALLITPAVAQTAPTTSTHRPAAATPSTTTPNPTTGSRTTAGSPEQSGLIDINSASAEELDKLPGVGTARAKAIIANRPYRGKDDLTQRKILPKNVYDQIKDKIVAGQGSAKESVGSSRPSSGTTKIR